GAILISIPSNGIPTDPTWLLPGRFAETMHVSVAPYPCRIGMPAARYEYDSAGESGAPPETKYRRRPPTPSRHFENTSLSASFCLIARRGNTHFRLSLSSPYFWPVASELMKIDFL